MGDKDLVEQDYIRQNLRDYVRPGEAALNIDKVAELCGATRRKLLIAIDDCDEMNLNVAVGTAGGVRCLPQKEWTVENLS